jgi:carboxyl-terminal processing protease
MRLTCASIILVMLPIVAAIGQPKDICDQARQLADFIQSQHIRPLPEKELETRIYDNGLRVLDPYAVLISRAQITKLKGNTELTHMLGNSSKDCLWLTIWRSLYQAAASEYLNWLDRYLSKPLTFTPADSLNLRSIGETKADDIQLRQQRERLIKYLVLEQIYSIEKVGPRDKHLPEDEQKARVAIIQREKERLQNLDQVFEEKLLEIVAQSFDPHTTYFTKSRAEEFKASLSTEVFAFGFSLFENERGEPVIMTVEPGSPAWKSNDLHEGDVLLSFVVADQSFAAADFAPAKLQEKLSEPTRIRLTVQKKGGTIKTVELEKEMIDNEDNTITPIKLTGSKAVGYISLPAFYSNWTAVRPQGIAQDVAHAIMKLNREKIDGLIIDLRDNGGGAVAEAIDLIGIFIDFGTLAVYQERNQEPVLIRDTNRGVIYNGPLVVMINEHSASASELVAASLQDHGRALIVGSPSFGKGTGQQMLLLPGSNESETIKITNSMIYRITGKSYQQVGVVPDIPIGLAADVSLYREKDLPLHLPTDSISKKIYTSARPALSSIELKNKSLARQTAEPAFQNLAKKQRQINRGFALTPEGFHQFFSELDDGVQEPIASRFKAQATAGDQLVLGVDNARRKVLEFQLDQLQKNIFLQEAFQILVDYINEKTK